VQGVVVTGTRLHRPNNMASAPVGYPQQAQDTARYPDATPNPIKRVAADPVSTFSIDVDTASYSNVRRFLTKQRQRPPRDAVRVEELVNYFDYDYPAATREEVFRAWTAVAPSPWAPGKRLLHVGLQGHELHPAERPPLNLVFLVDVSGSMQPQDRLPLAQKSLNVLVDKLRPRDRVSMVVYAGSAGQVLAPTAGTRSCGCGAPSTRCRRAAPPPAARVSSSPTAWRSATSTRTP
jgi:Ca-activated chloride channel family protein